MKLIDLTDRSFGRLTVKNREGTRNGSAAWRCRCECGQEVVCSGYKLRTGETKSCGCLHREVSSAVYSALNLKHGATNTPEYRSWNHMRARCNDPNGHAWKWYGGRGIRVTPRWDDFSTFLADMGPRPPGKTLDRIDVNGNYEPSNCRWATATEQNRNRRKPGVNHGL